MSPTTTLKLIEDLGVDHDVVVCSWREALVQFIDVEGANVS